MKRLDTYRIKYHPVTVQGEVLDNILVASSKGYNSEDALRRFETALQAYNVYACVIKIERMEENAEN